MAQAITMTVTHAATLCLSSACADAMTYAGSSQAQGSSINYTHGSLCHVQSQHNSCLVVQFLL